MGALLTIILGSALQFVGTIGLASPDAPLVAESHDGKWAVVAHYSGDAVEFAMIDRHSGREAWTFPGASPYSMSYDDASRIDTMVAFSPDDAHIAAGGTSLCEYDVHTGHRLWQHANLRVNAVAYSPDGRSIVAGGALPIVAAFDAGSGVRRWSVYHGSIVIALAVDPIAGVLASGSDGGGVRLWRLADGGELPHLRIPHLGAGAHMQAALDGFLAHEGRVLAVSFTNTGVLLTGGGDGSLRAWDPLRGRMLSEHICPDAITSIVDDQRDAVAACFDSGPAIFDSRTLLVRQYFGDDNGGATGLWTLPDAWLVAGGDGTLKKWSRSSFAIETLGGTVKSAALAPDGTAVAYAYGDREVHLASTHTLRDTARIDGVAEAKYECCFGRAVMLLAMTDNGVVVDTYSSEGFVDHHGAYRGMLREWNLRGREIARYKNVAAAQIAPIQGGAELIVTAPALTDTPWSVALINRRTGAVSVWRPEQTVTDRLAGLDIFNSAAPVVDDGDPAIVIETERYGRRVLQERELPSGRIVRTLAGTLAATTHGIVQDRRNGNIVVLGAQDGLTVLTLRGRIVSRDTNALQSEQLAGMDVSGGHIVFLTQPQTYGCDGSYHLRLMSEQTGRLIESIDRPVCAQNVQISDDGRVLAAQTARGVDIWALR